MLPRKPKELIAEFCLLNGYREEDMQVIITEAYEEIRRHVELMDYDYLSVPAIGNLFIKAWTVKRRLKVLANFKIAGFTSTEIERERLTVAYERMSDNFYEENDKDFLRTVNKGSVTKKGAVHDYSDIEGHIMKTWKPGTKCYLMGCRCQQCKDCFSVYRKDYNKRKKDEAKGNVSTGMGEQTSDS